MCLVGRQLTLKIEVEKVYSFKNANQLCVTINFFSNLINDNKWTKKYALWMALEGKRVLSKIVWESIKCSVEAWYF